MAVENSKTEGVRIIIGSHAGACGLPGVTICGCEGSVSEKVVIDREYFEKEKKNCKKLNGEKGGCTLCTADPDYSPSIKKFCPFSE